jgi:hypothetical protein
MGFIINESVDFPRIGISLSNVYVTIRGSYHLHKINDTYNLNAPYLIYTKFDITGLSSIETGFVDIKMLTFPADPVNLIYAEIKAKYPGKTFTDC